MILVLALVLVLAGATTALAAAAPVPGATYNGDAADGAAVRLTVSFQGMFNGAQTASGTFRFYDAPTSKVILWRGDRRMASTKSKAGGRFSFPRTASIRGSFVRASTPAGNVKAGACAAGSSTFIKG